jgi:hypothetical protein
MRGAAVLMLAGCFELPSSFRCSENAQCNLPNKIGSCVQHACAYYDFGCDSLLQWGSDSGELAGMCVPSNETDQGLSMDFGGANLFDLASVDLARDGGTTCNPPYLAATVENLTGASKDVGLVMRFELPAFRRCADLTAGGLMPARPRAAAAVPLPSSGFYLAVATTDELIALDPDSDARLWHVPVPGGDMAAPPVPIDVFPIVRSDGGMSAMVAYGTSQISDVYTYRGGFQQDHFTTADLGLTNVLGMTGSPLQKHLYALSTEGAAVDVTVFPTPAPSVYVPQPGGGETLSTIWYTQYQSNATRLAWLSGTNSVRFVTDVGSGAVLQGPYACTSCPKLVHVVPDTEDVNAFYALCEDGTTFPNERTIRHVTGGACSISFMGTDLPMSYRITRLAVVSR